MALTRTIARARLATPDRTVNTKLTNATRDHAKTVAHALITITITHAIVLMDSLEKIVPNMWIGVHKIHVKTALLARSVKTHTNVIVYRVGPENCATLKWSHAKMLPSEKG